MAAAAPSAAGVVPAPATREEQRRFYEENGYLLVKTVLPRGECNAIRQELHDLAGRLQAKKSIDATWGGAHLSAEERAKLQVWGYQRPSDAPQAAPGQIWDNRGWTMLGERAVQGGRKADRDKIAVGRNEGKFRKLMLVVLDSDLQMIELTVKFARGAPFKPGLSQVFRENERTRAIDLPGDDRVIRFGALYLDRGRVLARFEGRKLRSRPMGHTTIAVPEPDDSVHALAVRFFDGLELSGPVSLELKQDPDGRYWVIEPTVGRSDFWAGLCVANGVDLPLIEYRAQSGEALPAVAQRRTHLWINGERDPAALAWLLRHAPAQLLSHWPRGVYLDLYDPQPWLLALGRFLGAMPLRAVRKAGRLVSGKA